MATGGSAGAQIEHWADTQQPDGSHGAESGSAAICAALEWSLQPCAMAIPPAPAFTASRTRKTAMIRQIRKNRSPRSPRQSKRDLAPVL